MLQAVFLEWQPCHSPVMVFCLFRAIYLGSSKWFFKCTGILCYFSYPLFQFFILLNQIMHQKRKGKKVTGVENLSWYWKTASLPSFYYKTFSFWGCYGLWGYFWKKWMRYRSKKQIALIISCVFYYYDILHASLETTATKWFPNIQLESCHSLQWYHCFLVN